MSRERQRSARGGVSGFTLVEVIVVLAVVLLLTGIAVPMISGYLEDGRRARAAAEIKVLAAAVVSFYKDVGVYPARNSSGNNAALYVLETGTAVPTTNPFNRAHQFDTWARNGAFGDVLDNHLLRNTPQGSASGYPTTGNARWRGPYLAGSAANDPWGRPYIVNVVSSWHTHATNFKRLFVLSAGPNGVIDTDYRSTATTDLANDDIGIIIGQR